MSREIASFTFEINNKIQMSGHNIESKKVDHALPTAVNLTCLRQLWSSPWCMSATASSRPRAIFSYLEEMKL